MFGSNALEDTFSGAFLFPQCWGTRPGIPYLETICSVKRVTKESTRRSSAKLGGSDRDVTHSLREIFLNDILALWESDGAEILEKLRDDKPETLLRVLSSFIPKEEAVQNDDLKRITDEELEARIHTLIRSRPGRKTGSVSARRSIPEGKK
jgi:hypothetical protein